MENETVYVEDGERDAKDVVSFFFCSTKEEFHSSRLAFG